MLHVMKRVFGAIAALSLAACLQESSPVLRGDSEPDEEPADLRLFTLADFPFGRSPETACQAIRLRDAASGGAVLARSISS